MEIHKKMILKATVTSVAFFIQINSLYLHTSFFYFLSYYF